MDEIIAVAQQARDDFTGKNIDTKLLRELYLAYNPNVDIESFLRDAKYLFPSLNCGLASVYLQYKLGGYIVRGKYLEYSHTFLLLQGNLVVDITADQYSGPEVHVGNLDFPWRIA